MAATAAMVPKATGNTRHPAAQQTFDPFLRSQGTNSGVIQSSRARVEQIPILRYIVVGAGIASEGGAGVVAACAKKGKTNPITWSVLNELAFLWGAAPRVS
jgi:hypothetical protein